MYCLFNGLSNVQELLKCSAVYVNKNQNLFLIEALQYATDAVIQESLQLLQKLNALSAIEFIYNVATFCTILFAMS